MREALDEQKPRTELDSQRLALQKLSFDADIVLDLHCDSDAVMHLYTNPDSGRTSSRCRATSTRRRRCSR